MSKEVAPLAGGIRGEIQPTGFPISIDPAHVTKDEAFADVARLTAAIVRHTRASQELAADSLVEKALAAKLH